MKNKTIIGYEALTRVVNEDDNRIELPGKLFEVAHKRGFYHELDTLCRQKALKAFTGAGLDNSLLFVNFEPGILDNVEGSWPSEGSFVPRDVLDPSKVAIEIVESNVKNSAMLVKFVEEYRRRGYIIVIDDFGASHSNFDRIFKLKPDIIKIDRKLVNNVSNDFYKQSIITCIRELANKIGTLTLVEGVENIEDIITCYELGVDLFQGFYFSKAELPETHPSEECIEKVNFAAKKIALHLENSLSGQHRTQEQLDFVIFNIAKKLSGINIDSFDECLCKKVREHSLVESAYVLDHNGIQVSETICFTNSPSVSRNSFFVPAEKGADHSLKNYFYFLKSLRLRRFFTDSYISLATGSICRTMSERFQTESGENFILCLDFIP